MSQNNIVSITHKLESIHEEISALDKTDTYQVIASIQLAHDEIDLVAQENEISILRAIIHWMALNTEVDFDNEQQMTTLVQNDSYSNWIDVLATILRENDFTLLPILHQSLTSPDWIVRPSALLLKSVASWLNEIKTENGQFSIKQSKENTTDIIKENKDEKKNLEESALEEKINHQTSEQTEVVFKLTDEEKAHHSIDDLINKQILKAVEVNQETLVHQTVFEEIDIEKIENEYIQNLDLIEIVKEDQNEKFNIPLIETEKSSLDDESCESNLLDSNLDIDLIDGELIESDAHDVVTIPTEIDMIMMIT